MKTYSRFMAILLLFTVVVSAQETSVKLPAILVKQPSATVSRTQDRFQTTPVLLSGFLFLNLTDRLQGVFVNPQTRQPAYPKMPNVVGVELGRARAVITQTVSSVRISVVEGRYTNNYQPGVVIQQSPETGAYLKPESQVTLYYNPQPTYPRMPNLVGQDVATAESRLIRLTPKSRPQRIVSREHNPAYAEGVVINQFPQPRAELRPDVQVVLYLNPAQRFPKMPGLIGMDVSTAESRLYSLAPNIRPQRARARRYDPAYKEGVVVSQSPDAGADLTPNIGVVLFLNPPPPIPRMPNLIGMDLTTAGNRLRQEAPNTTWQQQQANAIDRNYPVGTVVAQSPDAGTELRQGSGITLYVNPRPTPTPQPTPVTVPDVRGLSYGQANGVLTGGQLRITATSNPAGNISDFRVTAQRPLPGALLPIGGTVFVTIEPTPPPSTPTPTPSPTPTLTPTPSPIPAIVPDVRKKPLTEAIGLLRSAQLEIGTVSEKDPKETASVVLEQQPLPDQRVAVGTRVNLVIGKQAAGERSWLDEIPKVLGVMGLGFLAFLLGRLWKYFRRNGGQSSTGIPSISSPPDAEPPPTAPAISFRTTLNASAPEFAASTDLHTSFALQFQPRADWGQQYISLTGGLVAAESEEL